MFFFFIFFFINFVLFLLTFSFYSFCIINYHFFVFLILILKLFLHFFSSLFSHLISHEIYFLLFFLSFSPFIFFYFNFLGIYDTRESTDRCVRSQHRKSFIIRIGCFLLHEIESNAACPCYRSCSSHKMKY